MAVKASEHYVLHEAVASTLTELGDFFEQVQEVAQRTKCRVYWRGQSDCRWGIISSLVRQFSSPVDVTDENLQQAERSLLDTVKEWVKTPKPLPSNDLEWLAFMQHHGIPTRMLDFTPDPHVATFFACEDRDEIEGRLIALLAPDEIALSKTEVAVMSIDDIPKGAVRTWAPGSQISPRLAAQKGVFVIGRLPSTKPTMQVEIRDREGKPPTRRQLLRAEVVTIMSIPLYLHKLEATRRETSPYPSCLTVRIRVDKAAVRDQLVGRSHKGGLRPPGDRAINHAFCYPDVDGLRVHSRQLKAILRGLS